MLCGAAVVVLAFDYFVPLCTPRYMSDGWCQYGASLVSVWCQYGVSLVSIWCEYGVSMALLWCQCSASKVLVWCQYGLTWCYYGVSMILACRRSLSLSTEEVLAPV
jgi:hypothetical protein